MLPARQWDDGPLRTTNLCIRNVLKGQWLNDYVDEMNVPFNAHLAL